MKSDYNPENDNADDSTNWGTEADMQLAESEWIGAIIRYYFYLRKKDFNTLYCKKDVLKNALIGWIFKMIVLIGGIYLLLVLAEKYY